MKRLAERFDAFGDTKESEMSLGGTHMAVGIETTTIVVDGNRDLAVRELADNLDQMMKNMV